MSCLNRSYLNRSYHPCLILFALFMACDDSSSDTRLVDQGLAGQELSEDLDSQVIDSGSAGETTAGETTAGEMTAGETTAGETTAGETTAGETTAGETTAGETNSPLPLQQCEQSIVLNCDFGKQRVDTGLGERAIDQYGCADGFRFPGKELLFEFIEAEAQRISVRARPLIDQYEVSYIMFILEGQMDRCDPQSAMCLEQRDTIINEPIVYDYQPNQPLWFVIDPRLYAEEEMPFELEVICGGAQCGDGALDPGEACDDGNSSSGDGCDETCMTEGGYLCSGTPSVCIQEEVEDCEENIEASQGTYQGDTRGCISDYMTVSGGCGNSSTIAGADQTYSLTIPPNKVLRATIEAVSESGFNIPKMWLGLDPTQLTDTCVQQSSEQIYWLNGSMEEETVWLVIDGVSADDQGAYQLQIDYLSPPERPGSSCASPIEINQSGTYEGDTSGAGLPSNLHGGVGGECVRTGGFWGYNAGPDELYHVSLQPGQSLSATSSVIGNWDHVLSIHSDCEMLELSCLVWDDYGNASVSNETAETQDYYLMIGGFHTYSSGEYRLNITIE